MGQMKYIQGLVGNPKGKRPFGRPGRKWNLRGRGWEVVDWIHLAQDRDQWRALVNMVMRLQVP
jgi:hypothetical protein